MKVYINYLILVLLVTMCNAVLIAQVGIGTQTPSAKASLDVQSQVNGSGPYLGLLLPRVSTEVARDDIPSQNTDKGMMVFVLNTGCLDIFNGTFWEHINCTSSAPPLVPPTDVWINEIHYDNTGVDTNEFIEIVGAAGINLAGYSLVLYNGGSRTSYNTSPLSGVITDDTATGFGFSFVNYPSNGIQNGNPDGVALVDPSGIVIQFLSYEGTFEAIGGVANGLTSTDIGVQEINTTTIGFSLQLNGTGTQYSDFSWSVPNASTQGALNTGQTIN